MKKIISLILCLLMLLSSVCTTAFAEGEYEFFEKRQAIASYNADAPADLVIPSEINGLVVETILDSAFTSEAAAVEKLTLPEGLMFISNRNFNKSPALATVTLPETLQVVGENVFRESAALTEITIPAAVTMIGKSSFAKNENLKSVTFTGMAPLYVGEYAFGSNHAEMVIYVPDDQIDAYIAVLPEGLNIQPSGANAVVVDYTASEDLFTFDAATGTITATTNRAPRVDIPATIGGVPVTAIGAGVFKESNYVCCIIVPEGVTTIGDEAFASCSFLDHVDLPDSVTAIGAKAFNGYQGLSLEMPAQLQTIGEKAFAYSNIDSIILPEGVTEIPASAFESAKFSSLTLPGNLITIGNNAFYKCKYYKEVTVPGSVTSIGSGAFAESDRLEKIILECDPSVLPADAISGEKVTVEHVGAAPVEESTVETTASSEGGIAGVWNAVSAEVDGETMDKAMLEMFGLLITLNFNEDGTGTLAMEGEAGDITWTENAGVVSIFVEGDSTTLNMNDDGTLSGDFGGVIIAFAKGDGEVAVGGETPVEVPADVDTSALLGTWFDGDATNFTIYADGTCVATDQYGDSWMDWEVVDGVPMITTGMWSSAPLVLNADGTLYVNDGMIVEKTFTFGAGEIRVGSTLAEPTGTIAASSAEEFFGEWKGETMVMESGTFALADMMMTMDLTINADGTMDLFDGAMTDSASWTFAEGYLTAEDGMVELALMEDGRLCMAQEFNILYLTRADGGEAPIAPVAPVATDPAENPVDLTGSPVIGAWNDGKGTTLTVNADGTCIVTDEWGDSNMGWEIVDGVPTITTGSWYGAPMILNDDGTLYVNDGFFVDTILMPGAYVAPDLSSSPVVGVWNDGASITFTVNADGTCVATDEWGNNDMEWSIKDGVPMITGGSWYGAPMILNDDGTLYVNDGWVVDTTFMPGELTVGSTTAPVVSGTVAGNAEDFVGTWNASTLEMEGMVMNVADMGMVMDLTITADGLITMSDGEYTDEAPWTLVDGVLDIMGEMQLTLTEDGRLVMAEDGAMMYFVRSEAGGQKDDSYEIGWIGDNGELVAENGYGSTDYIKVVPGAVVKFAETAETAATFWRGYVFYDEAQNYIGGSYNSLYSAEGVTSFEDEFTVPEGAAYVRVSFTWTDGCEVNIEAIPYEIGWVSDNGELVAEAGYATTDYMAVVPGAVVKFAETAETAATFWRGYVFYDEAQNYIGGSYNSLYSAEGVTSFEDEFAVPEGAAYVRVSFTWTDGCNVSCKVVAQQGNAGEAEHSDVEQGGAADMQALMNRKFVAKTYTAFGQTMDASMLGAEYSVLFRENGTCDFGIAGMVVPNLPWGLQKVAVGLTEVDAFVINYYGTMFNAVLTDSGFDMDYYGTMTLHFEAAE